MSDFAPRSGTAIKIESERAIGLAANERRSGAAKYRHYHLQRSMRRFNGSTSHVSEEA